jgi:DNA-binding MarR family transcriptional regulator
MSSSRSWADNVVLPALLRHARTTYGQAMRQALEKAGFGDIPKNGLYVLGGLAMGAGDAPLGVLVRELAVSKQAAGHLVDALVSGGYVVRAVDDEDRRRLTVTLTERGRAAAATQAAAREKIDAELIARVGEEDVARARRVLAALVEIGRRTEDCSTRMSPEPTDVQKI